MSAEGLVIEAVVSVLAALAPAALDALKSGKSVEEAIAAARAAEPAALDTRAEDEFRRARLLAHTTTAMRSLAVADTQPPPPPNPFEDDDGA